jgi:hypothetical protein
VPVRQALERYLASAPTLTFPAERGSDRLMARFENLERLARQRDLTRPSTC